MGMLRVVFINIHPDVCLFNISVRMTIPAFIGGIMCCWCEVNRLFFVAFYRTRLVP